MPIDSLLQDKFVPPYSPEPPRRRLLIATLTLIVALLGLALPASWLGKRSDGAPSAAVRPAAHQASPHFQHYRANIGALAERRALSLQAVAVA